MGKDYSLSMDYPLGHRLRELPGPLLLTGHTGFKGTWMTFLLEQLNVPVVGYSLPASKDSLYERAERTGAIPEALADIRNYEALEQFIDLHKPSTIIHMAAQPLVLKSYENPRETFEVNVMGTANLLDIAFNKDFVKAIIVVTTDKVYRNDNSGRAFVETDPLEGKDPYSASKVGTEAVVSAWQQIAKVSGGPRVVSVRAGNVIGGGDFAEDRIIPDIIRGVITGNPVQIRNPMSIRPWQHVLDPLWGYLLLLTVLINGKEIKNINFALNQRNLTVGEVVEIAKKEWDVINVEYGRSRVQDNVTPSESTNLQINAVLAEQKLNWRPHFDQVEAIASTLKWWRRAIASGVVASELVVLDVIEFLKGKKLE